MTELHSDNGLINYDDNRGEFNHDTIYRVVSSRLEGEVAKDWHLSAAHVLAIDPKTSSDHDKLSYHFLSGCEWAKALDHSLQAARPSYEIEAHREALIFYERAWRSLQHIETDMNVSVEVYERMGSEPGILSLSEFVGLLSDCVGGSDR